MTWRAPTPFETALWDDARERLEDILPLARHLFLAPRVEPLLLRNVRLRYTPQVPLEAESLLWFSPLVAARNTREIVFHLGIAKVLADEFMQQEHAEARLDELWAFTRHHTRHWSEEDSLERDLRYHALRGDDAALDEKLRHILRRIHQEVDEQLHIAFARLAKRALPIIAPDGAKREEARWLVQYAATALGDAGAWVDPGDPRLRPSWLTAKLPTPLGETRLGVEVRHDPDQGQVLHFVASQVGAPALSFGQPLPSRLHIASFAVERTGEGGFDPVGFSGAFSGSPFSGSSFSGGDELIPRHSAWYSVMIGSRITIDPPSSLLRLSTLEGAQWELHAEGPVGLKGKVYPARSPTLWLAHVEADRELAETIAHWLRSQGIEVELLPGWTGTVDETGSGAHVLRLWTHAARRYWSERPDQVTKQGGMLLLAEDVDLPAGGAPSGLLDGRDWRRSPDGTEAERLLAPLLHWLRGGELPLATSVESAAAANEIKALMTEIANLETTPPRRLEIGDRLVESGDPRPGVGRVEIEVDAEPPTSEREPGSDYTAETTRLLAEIANPKTSPLRRLEIGDRLAELGDPRPGVGRDARGLPDIEWVEIPGGQFIYQEGEMRELPTFWIARYPITNRQYQAFIADNGYRDMRLWRGLKQPAPRKATWPQSNRPRTDVNWYEALAFSRWLCARFGLEPETIRLPTEVEWERVARGTDGMAYPWGREYRSGHANVDEHWRNQGEWNLGQTMAVGMYPHGRSREGVEDLSGTVWEWCLNKYDKPEKTTADGSIAWRVLRGGSWLDNPYSAHADSRRKDRPTSRDHDLGFRLVSSVPIELHNYSEVTTMFEDNAPPNDEHTFGGPWTLKKLEALEKYLKAFNNALKKQGFTRVYIDAFAGTGRITLKNRDGNAVVDGSVRRALMVEPPFHKYCFIELKTRNFAALQGFQQEFPDKNLELIQDDANVALKDICRRFNWRDTRAVLFLDPYGLHVEWPTLEAIAATKAIDVWYLFPYSGLYRQAAMNADAMDMGKEEAITRLLGTDEWRTRFYEPPKQSSLFGDIGGDERNADHNVLLDFVSERLGQLFPAVTKPKVLYQGGDTRNPKGAPLFALYFAAANPDPRAFGLARKIAQDVLDAL